MQSTRSYCQGCGSVRYAGTVKETLLAECSSFILPAAKFLESERHGRGQTSENVEKGTRHSSGWKGMVLDHGCSPCGDIFGPTLREFLFIPSSNDRSLFIQQAENCIMAYGEDEYDKRRNLYTSPATAATTSSETQRRTLRTEHLCQPPAML